MGFILQLKEHEERDMIQTDNVIETTIQPELESSDLFQPTPTRQVNDELNILIGDKEEYIDAQPDENDLKSGKVVKSRTRTASKKKHYTEDSIRLYLQEIGRIRLLRADEEIELARKIADLLELERIREELMYHLDREPQVTEWANAVDMELPKFKRRLILGRRAKEKKRTREQREKKRKRKLK